MIRRRDFITLLGATAAAWPVGAQAQPARMPVLGFLHPQSQDLAEFVLKSLRQGLKDHGYVEGQNLSIKYALAQNQSERLPTLAAALVRDRVDVIVPIGVPAATAAKAATQSIPIVFNIGADPVERGLVTSLSHPGENLTGTSNLNSEVIGKRLELLRELVPGATTIAFLIGSGTIIGNRTIAQRSASALGLHLLLVSATSADDVETAFASITGEGAQGLEVDPDPFLESESVRDRIIALASRKRIPAVYAYPEFAQHGGLMSYGTDFSETWRLTGAYAGRVLKGEKPTNLPVQQATKMRWCSTSRLPRRSASPSRLRCLAAPTR
jgi:putative ABC transport system substrate-binding protein